MSWKPNGHYLLCPVCVKTQEALSVHLHEVCMKDSTPEAIDAEVEKAENDVQELLMSGRVFSYALLRQIMDDADPLSRLIEELQRHHLAVTGVPSPLPNASVRKRPSTRTSCHCASISSEETFHSDPDMNCTNTPRKLMTKKKAITPKRQSMLIEKNHLTPHDCLALLRAAKKDFLAVMEKAKNATLEKTECSFVVYYLQAVVILKYLQRPCVVERMTVQEWIVRKTDTQGNAVIGVNDPTSAFALSQEEDSWFDTYFSKVRPRLQNKKRKRDDTDEEEKFFISTTGRPIHSASNDLNRLHHKYNIEPVKSQVARRTFETASQTLTDTDKSLVADYLTHCSRTVKKPSSETDNIVRGRRVLAKLAGDPSAESAEEDTSAGAGGVDGADGAGDDCGTADDAVCGTQMHPMDVKAAFEKLLETHPVTLDGDVPNKRERKKVSPDCQRALCERWLQAQMDLRKQHVLAYFCRRLPTENRLSAWITKQGWKSNIPIAAGIIEEWKPSGSEDTVMDSHQIQKFTTSQKWRGLLVTQIEEMGKAVIATRRFQTGEVVCDYHGRVMTAEEGEEVQENASEEETGHLFYYTDKNGQSKCIDAHSASCECHPEQPSVCRYINHSTAGANLRPRMYTVVTDGEEKDVILLFATRNIEANEELLFNYNVNKQSNP